MLEVSLESVLACCIAEPLLSFVPFYDHLVYSLVVCLLTFVASEIRLYGSVVCVTNRDMFYNKQL
jgi:hypothetical protein